MSKLLTILLSLTLFAPAAFTSVQEAQALLQSITEKEVAEGVLDIHRSEIILSPKETCNTILMLHGLYESKYYLKGITQYFLSRGFNVVHILSSGHFRPSNLRMENISYTDWKQDALLGLEIAKKLSSNVFVFGYSTGGTMAADLALNYPQDVKGLVFFAPALKLTGRTQAMVSSGALFGIYPAEKCDPNKLSQLCKIIGSVGAGKVKDSIPLLQEGLSWSPLAGVEVYNYTLSLANINASAEFLTPRGHFGNLYVHLIDAYKKITAPVFMAVDKGDLTIDDDFAQDIFSRWTQTKSLVLYSRDQGIAHTNIIKYKQDAYKGSKDFYNKHTDQLEKEIDAFMAQVNPSCQ